MLAKRLVIASAMFVLFLSTSSVAQKADMAFTVGGTFVSDANINAQLICTLPPCATLSGPVHSGHSVYLAGTPALQIFNARVAALYVEVPIAGIPSQTLHVGSFSTVFSQLSSVFVTPALRLKFLPSAHISPFASVGGGWAHYSVDTGSSNEAALQFGGGLDFKTGIPLLGFRAEVRDFASSQHNLLSPLLSGSLINTATNSGLRHNVLAGGGVVLRF